MATALRVLSFNIRGSYCADGPNAWPERAALNVRTIRSVAPHLIGFQELQLGNLETYGRELSDYDFHLGPKYNTRPAYCWPALFWNPEKLRKLSADEFWLSRTPDRHSGDWGTAYFRSALIVGFRCLPDGPDLLVVNTHLDNVSEPARVEGAKVILERLDRFGDPSLPVLLMADFNCDAGSPVYQAFLAAGFADTFTQAGLTDGPDAYTFHNFKGRRDPRWGRIDWILTRDGRHRVSTRSFTINQAAEPPVYPSDHWPIVAEVELTHQEKT